MPFCYNCGTKIEEDDLFCPQCGVKLQEEPSDKPVPQVNQSKAEEPRETPDSVLDGRVEIWVCGFGCFIEEATSILCEIFPIKEKVAFTILQAKRFAPIGIWPIDKAILARDRLERCGAKVVLQNEGGPVPLTDEERLVKKMTIWILPHCPLDDHISLILRPYFELGGDGSRYRTYMELKWKEGESLKLFNEFCNIEQAKIIKEQLRGIDCELLVLPPDSRDPAKYPQYKDLNIPLD